MVKSICHWLVVGVLDLACVSTTQNEKAYHVYVVNDGVQEGVDGKVRT